MDEVICAVCGLPIVGDDYDNRHTGHEERCPRYGEDIDEEPADVDCYCDVNYHAECCPDCKVKYEVLDSDLNLVLEEAETEAAAIAFVIAELSTEVFPAVIREDNGEITAIVWCGVVYRPEQEA